jgi:hypothetical protein
MPKKVARVILQLRGDSYGVGMQKIKQFIKLHGKWWSRERIEEV